MMKQELKRERKQIVAYSMRHSGVDTAVKFGISESQVSYYRKLAGLKRPNRSATYRLAFTDYKNGLGGISKLAKQHEIGVSALAQYIKNGGTFKQPNDSRIWFNPNASVQPGLLLWA